jgi:hypothetical protein
MSRNEVVEARNILPSRVVPNAKAWSSSRTRSGYRKGAGVAGPCECLLRLALAIGAKRAPSRTPPWLALRLADDYHCRGKVLLGSLPDKVLL